MTSIITFGAHPDDETMLAGGTLAMLSQRGVAVHIVCATRGEGGELGDPPVCERSAVAQTREAELRCAAQALGAASLQFLDYIDPPVGPGEELFAFAADEATLVEQIRTAIRYTHAQIVITHGSDGEYGHPAHLLMHAAVREAVMSLDPGPIVYSWAAQVPGIEDRIWNKNDPADFALDITPWLNVKEAAAQCHVSQHALFKRRREAETIREILRLTEGFRRQFPTGSLDDPFAQILRAAGAWTPETGSAT